MATKAPVFLNLMAIRLPITALFSILHRFSGAVLFLLLPLLLYLLHLSLSGPSGLTAIQEWAAHPLLKLVLLLISWASIHHILAGVRHLLLDLHWGVARATARASAIWLLVLSVVLTLWVGVRLW